MGIAIADQNDEARNVAIVKSIYEVWSGSEGGGLDDVAAALADDVDWRSLADGRIEAVAFTKPRKGKADALAYLEELTRDWSMNEYTVHEYIAQGDRVVVLATVSWTHKGTGKTTRTEKADVIRLRDGKIAAFMEYYDTLDLVEAAK